MADLPPFPSQDKLAYRILELTAICGELPSSLLPRLPESTSYLETVIRGLKKDKLLRVYYRDRLRGFRLTASAKSKLLEINSSRFSFYLTGNAETNLLKSEPSRRMRLHSLAQVYVLMMNASIEVFRDRKPDIFSPDGCDQPRPRNASFYSSREIKELGGDTIKIRSSRMNGLLITQNGLYVTYHGAQNFAKWDYRAEQRVKALMKSTLCYDRLVGQYQADQLHGLLISKNMDFLFELLSTADSHSRCFFLLDGNYNHFYYLTDDRKGEILLKILKSPKLKVYLDGILSQDLSPKNVSLSIEHDGVDKGGNPVLFSYLPDLPRLVRFNTALELQNRTGTLICFDFQRDALRKSFGQQLNIQTISFAQFERRVLHRQT